MHSHTFAVMVYGDSPYLEECLISLQQQSMPSAVYITTSTPSAYIDALAKKYELPVLVNKNSQGIASDWNFSLSQAKTKYVTLAHQDDLYLAGYTESLLKAAECFDDTLICFSEIINQ